MAKIENRLNEVSDRRTFLRLVETLISDLASDQCSWGNKDLGSYLGGSHGWVEDMDLDVFYQLINRTDVFGKGIYWRVLADILVAARTYE